MNGAELRRLLRRVLAKALARDDEAQGSLRSEVAVDGVPCVAVCKASLSTRGREGARSVEGECMVYLSCRDTGQLVCGFGWLRFGISERSLARADEFFDWALCDARAELERHPEFLALRERGELGACAPAARLRPARRARL